MTTNPLSRNVGNRHAAGTPKPLRAPNKPGLDKYGLCRTCGDVIEFMTDGRGGLRAINSDNSPHGCGADS